MSHCIAVTERLTDFAAVNFQVIAVQPIPRKLYAASRLTLGDLVGVVHGNVVNTAGVDVNRLSKQLHRHGAALQMPTREAHNCACHSTCHPGRFAPV